MYREWRSGLTSMGVVPEGCDTIHLPEAEYLQFRGQPFREEDYCEAIRTVQALHGQLRPGVSRLPLGR